MSIARLRRLPRATRSAWRQRRSDGFTLLELLVGLVVLGLLTVMLVQASRFGQLAWATQTRNVERYTELLALDNALRQLIGRMKPAEADEDTAAFSGNRVECRFVTDLPIAAGGLPVGEAAVALSVDRAQRLVLSWTPHPHVRWLGSPVPPRQAVLLDHVAGIEFGYWDPTVSGTDRWLRKWNSRAQPRLIRLHIEFSHGDGRHWPDIVVATAEEPAQ